jgi:opacity protein-like surface antigen
MSGKRNKIVVAPAPFPSPDAVLPNLLAYGTGGFGWAHSIVNVFNHGDQGISQPGYAAGAGLEYKFYGNWIARGEYLHYDFGNVSVPGTHIKEDIDVVRGGLSYKF